MITTKMALSYVLQYAFVETFGTIFKEHRLVSVKVNPIGNSVGMEGHRCLLVCGEDKEAVSVGYIVRGEGNLQSVMDFVKDLGKKAHSVYLLVSDTKVVKKSDIRKGLPEKISEKITREKFGIVDENVILYTI